VRIEFYKSCTSSLLKFFHACGKRDHRNYKRSNRDTNVQRYFRVSQELLGQTAIGKGILREQNRTNARIARQYVKKQELKQQQSMQLDINS